MKLCIFVLLLLVACAGPAEAANPSPADAIFKESGMDFKPAAEQVSQYIQQNFYSPSNGLYHHSMSDANAEFMWGNGIIFSQLVAAARHDPDMYLPIMNRFFKAMDVYWDKKDKVPGYEPSPTRGGGNDKYYDDNAWMVLTFTEAYSLTNDRAYLARSEETLKNVLSGWDDQLGGGIWWHEGHKGHGKNTCVNAPAAVGCLRIAQYSSPSQSALAVAKARAIMNWTDKNLFADGLYIDNIRVDTGKKNYGKLTYNTALMIRAYLDMYRLKGNINDLNTAKKVAQASDFFTNTKTGAFRDNVKWSHLMVEADVDLYRTTHEEYLLKRAIANAKFEYQMFKDKPPEEVIEAASIARTLWLLADLQYPAGQQFWLKMDRLH